jgi:hypothetical protein
LREGATLDWALSSVRDSVISAFAHSEYSYERLVERVRHRHPGHSGNFISAYIQFQPRALTASKGTTGRFNPNVNVHNGRAKFDLILNASDRGRIIACVLDYNTEAFSASKIAAIESDFREVIRRALTDPAQVINGLPRGAGASSGPRVQAQQQPASSPSVTMYTAAHLGNTERVLARAWREVLDHEPSSESDFYESGGHSLLLAQLAWRLRQEFGQPIPIGALASHPRFDAMVRMLAQTVLPADVSPITASQG